MTESVNDRTRAEKEQRLEKSMSKQVHDSRSDTAHA